MLLDVSCNVNLRNEDQSTALHWAARKDNGMAIKLLLQARSPPAISPATSSRDLPPRSPPAISPRNLPRDLPPPRSHRDLATFRSALCLPQAGADVGVKNKWGATALDNAMFARHHEAIMLLSSDAEVRVMASEGFEWLRMASDGHHAPLERRRGDCFGRLRLASNGFGWLRLASNGFGWLRMAPDGFEWLRMASDGSGWLRMARGGL